jgi:putative ABC transport system substrate-binding protein
VRRREFITLIGGMAAWPFAVDAQQGERMRRMGLLLAADAEPLGPFREALGRLGYFEGKKLPRNASCQLAGK